MRKDSLKSLIAALKSEGLVPTSMAFDAEGNLLNLQVQPVQDDEPEQKPETDRKPITFRPMRAIDSVGKTHPVQ